MIIQSIEMNNFRQYVGKQKIEFSTDKEKNVTVLIGVNTSGKTTIIRAFEWCLYGKNGFEDPVLLNSDVRSNMHVGDTQTTYVAVTFIHDDMQYILKRSFTYVCSDRRTEGNDVVVTLNKKPDEDLTLEYLLQDGQTKTNVERNNIEESIDRVLPTDLSDYFFFGGERISGIANRADLSKAVRGLMRLDVLEHSRDHLQAVAKKFNGMIDTSGNAAAQKARDSLDTYKKKKAVLQENLQNAEKERDYWYGKEKEYSAELSKSNVEQVKTAKKERDRIESSLKREKERLEACKKAMVAAFNMRPYAFFGMPAIKKSLEILEAVKESTESVPAMEQESIDYLIHRGICICGTRLDVGTKPCELVIAERRKLPPEQIGTVVNNYKNKAEGYLAGSESYCDTVGEKYKEYRETLRRIGQLEDDLKKQSEMIIDDTDAKAIEDKRREAVTKYKEAMDDYNQINADIGSCDANIKNCENAIEKYAKSSSKNSKVARYIAYAEKVLEWLIETYQSKEVIVREQLQKRVNDNFAKMYHGERSILIDEKYRVKYADVTTEESDGLKAVKSFAFIAALVSMAKDKILDDSEMKLGQVYPLVMDAPFSNVDEIHIDNICKILPKTANQVIMAVMQKDWEYAAKNLDQYVGISYTILKDRDGDGKEIDTSTHIRKEATNV